MTDSFRYQHAAWKLFGIIAVDKVKNSFNHESLWCRTSNITVDILHQRSVDEK